VRVPEEPPERLHAKLAKVALVTGLTILELWSRQSRATKMAAWKDIWTAFWSGLSLKKRAALKANWRFWGRPAQQTPVGKFFIWLILAGRGWGKTRTGAQWVIEQARKRPGSIGCLLGATSADVRDTMIHGDSGILACSPPDFMPVWEPSKNWLTWPNKARALVRTAEKPDRVRGPNLDWAWVDEFAAFRFIEQAWEMLQMCLRKGANPQVCITTTPRPLPQIIHLVEQAASNKGEVVCTRGSSWDNYWVLSSRWFKRVVEGAKGALARQEVWAEILDRVEGALWSFEQIWALQVDHVPENLEAIVVAVDPSEEDGPDNDECGIIVAGRDSNLHGYVLEDLSERCAAPVWARKAYEAYLRWEADCIVVETNRGGKMVRATIYSVIREGEPRPRIVEVKASRGKRTRAEPCSAVWAERRFHMVGKFSKLENEMCTYVPGVSKKSPNRLDAKVWAAAHLFPHHRAA